MDMQVVLRVGLYSVSIRSAVSVLVSVWIGKQLHGCGVEVELGVGVTK